MIDWKFKRNAKPVGSSNGFWYDLTMGGYIKPEDLLVDEEQVKKVKEAIEILWDFEEALDHHDLLNEF